MYQINSTILNRVIKLNKNQERELAKLSPDKRAGVAQDLLVDNEKRAIAAEQRFAPIRAARQVNKDSFNPSLTEAGFAKIPGLGVGRPAFATKEGLGRLIAGIELLKALHATMPEKPTFPSK